jgi:prefoldin subunit 5
LTDKIILLSDILKHKLQKERELEFYQQELEKLQQKMFFLNKDIEITNKCIDIIEQEKVSSVTNLITGAKIDD